MKFPISVAEAKKNHNLHFDSYQGFYSVLDDTSKKSNGPRQYFKVLFPAHFGESIGKVFRESSIVGRKVNGYSFYLVSNGDSLRKKLESDFGGEFELKDNKTAIKSGSKWTTCYEMRINNCLYVATSNWSRGRSLNCITFVYGLDEAERADFNH